MKFKYKDNPLDFIRQIFHVEPEKWQLEVIESYKRFSIGQARIRMLIHTGHGVGKTALCSWLIIHALLTYRDRISGVVTANTRAQLQGKLIREIRRWIYISGLHSLFEISNNRIQLANTTGIVAFESWKIDRTESFAGLHEDNVLVIFDEASGIPDAIFEVIEGSLTASNFFFLCTGNPTRSSGMFRNIALDKRIGKGFEIMQVSTLDVSIADKAYANNIAERFGANSPIYKVRVEGSFVDSSHASSLFAPRELDNILARSAISSDELNATSITYGLDVARYGDSDTVLAIRRGALVEVIVFDKDTIVENANSIVEFIKDNEADFVLNIDSTGIGAGMFDVITSALERCKLRFVVNGVNFASKYSIKDVKTLNARTALFFSLKFYLQSHKLYYSGDLMELRRYLSTLRIQFNDSRVSLDKKVSNGVETDIADAIALTFYGYE